MSFSAGSNKSKSQSTSSSGPKDVTPREFKHLRGQTADVASGLLDAYGNPDPSVALGQSQQAAEFGQEHLTAPITANEEQLISDLMGYQANNPGMDYIEASLRGDYLPGGSEGNPFLAAMIESAQRPTFEGLEDTLSRSLPSLYTLAGQTVRPGAGNIEDLGSSAFLRHGSGAISDALRQAADIATRLSFDTFNAERGRQQESVTLRQQELDTTMKTLDAVALPRLIQQYGIEAGLEQLDKVKDTALETLRILAGMTAATPAQESKSQSTSKGSGFQVGFTAGQPQ